MVWFKYAPSSFFDGYVRYDNLRNLFWPVFGGWKISKVSLLMGNVKQLYSPWKELNNAENGERRGTNYFSFSLRGLFPNRGLWNGMCRLGTVRVLTNPFFRTDRLQNVPRCIAWRKKSDVKDCCFFNKYQLKIEDLPEELVDDIKVTFKIFDVDNGRNTYRFWWRMLETVCVDYKFMMLLTVSL